MNSIRGANNTITRAANASYLTVPFNTGLMIDLPLDVLEPDTFESVGATVWPA